MGHLVILEAKVGFILFINGLLILHSNADFLGSDQGAIFHSLIDCLFHINICHDSLLSLKVVMEI